MQFTISKLAVLALVTLTGLPFAQEPFLADRHTAKNIPCSACHGKDKPTADDEVASEACLKCHSRDAIVEKYASAGERNPHKNHLGEIDCALCHKGHSKSEAYCMQCHKSNFQMPMK